MRITAFDKQDKHDEKRKLVKTIIDTRYNFSVSEKGDVNSITIEAPIIDNKARLLTEGTIVDGDEVRLYIQKGTLKKFMNGENEFKKNIDDDFVGLINIGHRSYAKFPFPVGAWKKSNLHLVDIEDGRQAIDIDVSCIDRDSIFVKELERRPNYFGEKDRPLGLSAEVELHTNIPLSEKLGFQVVDEGYIDAAAIVGACGDVYCGGLKLGGDDKMADINKEKLEEGKNVSTEENVGNEEPKTEPTEPVKDTVEPEEGTENVEGEKTTEDTEGKDEFNSRIEEIERKITSLSEENAQLKEENEKLKAEKNAALSSFEKLMSIGYEKPSVNLAEEKPKEEEQVQKPIFDQIGE